MADLQHSLHSKLLYFHLCIYFLETLLCGDAPHPSSRDSSNSSALRLHLLMLHLLMFHLRMLHLLMVHLLMLHLLMLHL